MTHLLSALWQGAAIALAAAALLRGRRTLSAATRHAVWLVALVAVAVLTTHHVVQGLAAGPDLRPPRLAMDAAAPNAAALVLPAAPVWTMVALAVVWAAVTFASVMRLIRGFLALARIRRHARPLPTELAAALRFWNRRPAATRTAALMVCDRVGGACAVGLSHRPMIVLSPALVRSLDAAALDQIVMHEHAHLVRRDDWTQALEQCVLAVFGLHPAVRYLARRLDADREMACDDRVVALTGSAAAYATCLARAAETAAAPAWSTALVTNAAGRGTLVARVQRLLDGTVNRAPRIQRLALATGGAALTLLAVAASSLAPVVVFAEPDLLVMTLPAPPPAVGASQTMAGAIAAGADTGHRLQPPSTPARRVRTSAQAAGFTSDLNVAGVRTGRPESRRAMAPSPSSPAGLRDGALGTESTATARANDAPLASRAILDGSGWPVTDAARRSAAVPGTPGAWTAAGSAIAAGATRMGAATGQASGRTGRAIGGFFERTAKAVADRF